MKVLLLGMAAAVGLGILLVTTSSRAQSTRPRRVLAVGDSLTTGAYPRFLEQLLPKGSSVVVKAVAKAGAQTIFKNAANELASGDYDVVVILAGVNDLSSGRGPTQAANWLQQMYTVAGEAGAYVVAVEVLPWRSASTPETYPGTKTLNQWIHANNTVDIVVDTSSMGDSSGQLLSKYDNGSGIHLSRAGNECLARLVADAIEKE